MLDIYDEKNWAEAPWDIQIWLIGEWMMNNRDYKSSLLNNPWF